VTADKYQSSDLLQRLKREGFEVKLFSVDKDVVPYRMVASWMLNDRVKVGRNVILKNNFHSLIELVSKNGEKKVDHSKGKIIYDDGGSWEKSYMGIHAKDVSDSFTGSVYNTISLFGEMIPSYQWLADKEIENSENDGKDEKLTKELLTNIFEEFRLK
jgi:hypothetical protein